MAPVATSRQRRIQCAYKTQAGQKSEKCVSIFDTLASCIQVEEEPALETPEEGAKAILEILQPGKQPQRIITPEYEPPELKTDYEKSAPFPIEYKADVNKRKGIVEAYMSVYDDPETRQPYVDPYLDVVERGAFSADIAKHEAKRKRNGDTYLMPYLWQHKRDEPIGGVASFRDAKEGMIYVAQVFPSSRLGQMALDMLEARVLASSFGYDAIKSYYKGDVRHLTEIHLHEVSACTFPANPHARVLSVKSQFFVPSNYPGKPAAQKTDWQKVKADVKKADELFNQLIGQGIQAYQQYKREHR